MVRGGEALVARRVSGTAPGFEDANDRDAAKDGRCPWRDRPLIPSETDLLSGCATVKLAE